MRKRRQKDWMVSNFALLLVVFKWHHGSEGVNLRWHQQRSDKERVASLLVVFSWVNLCWHQHLTKIMSLTYHGLICVDKHLTKNVWPAYLWPFRGLICGNSDIWQRACGKFIGGLSPFHGLTCVDTPVSDKETTVHTMAVMIRVRLPIHRTQRH